MKYHILFYFFIIVLIAAEFSGSTYHHSPRANGTESSISETHHDRNDRASFDIKI